MHVKVNESESARVLQMNGYSRYGDKVLNVGSIDEIRTILNRDDITVTTVTIKRKENEEAAQFIDDLLVEGYTGKYDFKRLTVKTPYSSPPELEVRTRSEKMYIEESEVVIKDRFDQALDGKVPVHPTDEEVKTAVKKFNKAVSEWVEEQEAEIKSLEESITEKQKEVDEINSDYPEILEKYDQ